MTFAPDSHRIPAPVSDRPSRPREDFWACVVVGALILVAFAWARVRLLELPDNLPARHRASAAGANPAPPRLGLDPNTAPPEVLETIPGFGPAIVARVVSERERAPFRTLDELADRVPGVGPSLVERLRPRLRVEPAPTPEPELEPGSDPELRTPASTFRAPPARL